jgi:uncharacterized protein
MAWFFARCALIAALLLASLWGHAQDQPVPPLSGRVVDETATLTPDQKRALESKLQAFEQRKGTQIALLITGTTSPEPIESYSMRVAEAWKIGRKGVDDGVLIIVAKSDRAMRLEVGYGLEGALTDATANRLIDEVFVPYFREGHYYEGLNAGIDRLIKVIDGEPLPAPKGAPDRHDTGSMESYFVPFIVAALALGGLLRRVLGRLPAALVLGAGIGILAWFIIASMLLALLAGLVAFLMTLFGGMMPGRVGGGFGGGGFGGGGFGGGFGGGGFSGGGGGFGGGGASGRW